MLESTTRTQRSIRSLRTNWLICSSLLALTIWCATQFRDRFSAVLSLTLLLLGLIFSFQCLRWELRAITDLEAAGIEASYWYVLIPFGIVLLILGVVIEAGIFLLFAHYTLRHTPPRALSARAAERVAKSA